MDGLIPLDSTDESQDFFRHKEERLEVSNSDFPRFHFLLPRVHQLDSQACLEATQLPFARIHRG